MPRLVRLVLLGLALASTGPAAAGVVKTTPEEEARLAAREVVIRELPTQGDGAVRVLAVVDIRAGTDAVWAALLDFDARKKASSAVQEVTPYAPSTPSEMRIRWRLSKFGVDVVYHNRYLIDRAKGRLEHMLDPTQPNDLTESRGVYDIYPSPSVPGATRLVWEVESNFGRAIPGFVQQWMSTGATRDFMADMARRAEARAAL